MYSSMYMLWIVAGIAIGLPHHLLSAPTNTALQSTSNPQYTATPDYSATPSNIGAGYVSSPVSNNSCSPPSNTAGCLQSGTHANTIPQTGSLGATTLAQPSSGSQLPVSAPLGLVQQVVATAPALSSATQTQQSSST